MTTQIALLRGINVGGNNLVAMAALRGFMESIGFPGAQTLLQSGNIVFRSKSPMGAKLEALLETEAKKRLKLGSDFFVRTADEWKAIIAGNPFRSEAKADPGHTVLMLLKGTPSSDCAKLLKAAIKGPERFHLAGTHAYFVYPDGIGKSKVNASLVDRHFGTRSTARNWNTVLKLGALSES